MIEVCKHCGRKRPEYIADPTCPLSTERTSFVYCEYVEEQRKTRQKRAKELVTSFPQTEAGERSAELSERLRKSGLLDGYRHGEIVTAFILLGAKAVREGTGFPPKYCLSVIAKTSQEMMALEAEHDILATLWESEENWGKNPARPA